MFGWKRRKIERLDFIVPGAQKSGTTALRYFLKKHPQIALIVLLRDPIDRAFAHWNMQRFKGRESLDFLDALKEEPCRIAEPLTLESRRFAYIDRGFYSDQLERVFKLFPREQVQIVK